MLGNPKYTEGDIVKFEFNDEIKEGAVYIVDEYGTFFNDSDVSYDILVEKENALYKHLIEHSIIGKVGEKKLIVDSLAQLAE